MSDGRCINATGETILVYGPKSATTPQDKDNALYRLPSSRKTPDGWDCDGIYVPNDRTADQLLGSDIAGPVAIKYVGLLSFEIERDGTKYKLPGNQGAFRPSETCCPSDFPNCVCWEIPDRSHEEFAGYPEVPGHLPA
ncbi:hypothetical protein AB1L30_14055 [Bremerella sp. JC817]|uniref:hypothetical protein n=1 Tax=Bremerella sp. JC817 TaxID=3231756 RepID=UPI0034574500